MRFLKGKRRGKEGVTALKIDIAKAYDRMEWSYLKSVMLAMGFSRRWVQLMMACMSNV